MTRREGDSITVTDDGDVVLAGRRTKSVLEAFEFDESTVEEIVLVVHELASNIVKHAGTGTVTLVPLTDGGEDGIEIRALDSGPGIADVDRAIADGYSTAGGLGGGLGTVHRLMDDVVIDPSDDVETGVEIVATRWTGEPPTGRDDPPFEVGAATRPLPGHDENGDAFLIEHRSGQTVVGVIDGLGHGRAAHLASRKAKRYILTHSTQRLSDIFAGVERECRGTRGVVMLLARFDWMDRTVTLGSVGNITLRICGTSEPRYLPPSRGVLGANAPSPSLEEWDWDSESVMVVHSDGLRSDWNCDEFSFHDDGSATDTANELLRSLSNQDDDATVLVVDGVDR